MAEGGVHPVIHCPCDGDDSTAHEASPELLQILVQHKAWDRGQFISFCRLKTAANWAVFSESLCCPHCRGHGSSHAQSNTAAGRCGLLLLLPARREPWNPHGPRAQNLQVTPSQSLCCSLTLPRGSWVFLVSLDRSSREVAAVRAPAKLCDNPGGLLEDDREHYLWLCQEKSHWGRIQFTLLTQLCEYRRIPLHLEMSRGWGRTLRGSVY